MKTQRSRYRKWDEQDLIRRLCHALDIAALAVEHVAPVGYTDPQRPSASVRPEKVIAETAVLLHGATLAIRHAEVATRIHRVARQLVPHARSSKMGIGLALNPALAFDYSLAHIILTRLGYPDPHFDWLLTRCRAAQAHGGRERLPHRSLEQDWIDSLRNQIGVINSRSVKRTARLSLLACPMDLFASTDEDLYAFTHAVMYVTGLQLNAVTLPRTRAVILSEAEAALARCLDAQDYDLAGEILLAWPLTGKIWSPAACFAFRVLADVEDKAGFLPTPSTRVSELKAREGSERTLYLVASAYHTAYVMGLLCAAALQPGCLPPANIPIPRRVVGCGPQLLPLLSDVQAVPHWRETFDKLPPRQADALAGFLFNIALQRRAARRDFSGLEALLRFGYQHALAATPAASQAAEMLERVALYVGSIQPTQLPIRRSNSIIAREPSANGSQPASELSY
jgi:hypothetical protein